MMSSPLSHDAGAPSMARPKFIDTLSFVELRKLASNSDLEAEFARIGQYADETRTRCRLGQILILERMLQLNSKLDRSTLYRDKFKGSTQHSNLVALGSLLHHHKFDQTLLDSLARAPVCVIETMGKLTEMPLNDLKRSCKLLGSKTKQQARDLFQGELKRTVTSVVELQALCDEQQEDTAMEDARASTGAGAGAGSGSGSGSGSSSASRTGTVPRSTRTTRSSAKTAGSASGSGSGSGSGSALGSGFLAGIAEEETVASAAPAPTPAAADADSAASAAPAAAAAGTDAAGTSPSTRAQGKEAKEAKNSSMEGARNKKRKRAAADETDSEGDVESSSSSPAPARKRRRKAGPKASKASKAAASEPGAFLSLLQSRLGEDVVKQLTVLDSKTCMSALAHSSPDGFFAADGTSLPFLLLDIPKELLEPIAKLQWSKLLASLQLNRRQPETLFSDVWPPAKQKPASSKSKASSSDKASDKKKPPPPPLPRRTVKSFTHKDIDSVRERLARKPAGLSDRDNLFFPHIRVDRNLADEELKKQFRALSKSVEEWVFSKLKSRNKSRGDATFEAKLADVERIVTALMGDGTGHERTQGYAKNGLAWTSWHDELARLLALNILLPLLDDDDSEAPADEKGKEAKEEQKGKGNGKEAKDAKESKEASADSEDDPGVAMWFGCDLDELTVKQGISMDEVRERVFDQKDLRKSLEYLLSKKVRVFVVHQRHGQVVVSPGGTGASHAVLSAGRLFHLAHNAPFRLEYLASTVKAKHFPAAALAAGIPLSDGNLAMNTSSVVPVLRLQKYLQDELKVPAEYSLGAAVEDELKKHEALLQQCKPLALEYVELKLTPEPEQVRSCAGFGNDSVCPPHNADLYVIDGQCLHCFAKCWLP